MTDDWPKPWDDITANTDGPWGATWMSLGPIRVYNDTVYINPDAAWEGENGDRWMPLGQYLAGHPVDEDGDGTGETIRGP